jgi:uncharacterized protein (DUF2225 family)
MRNRRLLGPIFCGFLVLAGLHNPALATTLSDKEFQCALCGKDFTDKVLRSTNVTARDPEFRPYATGLQPLPYLVHACPHCGFTDSDHRLSLNDREKSEIKKFLAAYCQKNNCGKLTPAQKYEVLARTYEIRQKPAPTIATQYHRAAWMADDAGDAAEAKVFREKTIRFFTQALQSNQVPAKEVPLVTYLVGELHRRTGNFPAALEWFSRVKDPDPQLARILQQQKDLALKKDQNKAKLPPRQ